ncbi:translation initiation factor IF-1A [Candidatus Woesearchaeota archaeon]|nr:translation initiation factor IF-1A [Candidatus Woesearchaeota archaeon]
MGKKPQGRKPRENKPQLSAEEQEQQKLEMMRRTPTPRGNQVIGICEQRVGGSRMKVRCMDGKIRICRIPGRLKRHLWIREGDVLLIEPWELSADNKGDVVFKYRPIQIQALKKKGLLKTLESEEF